MATIGLCMIVKNESAFIERCLNSICALVDYVLVEDTGSTDGTQDIVRAWLVRNALPGEVIEEPWQDFAYNRSHVMARLRDRSHIDYGFTIDADDRLELENGFNISAFKTRMEADLYDIELRHNGTQYWRPMIWNNHLPFCFKGVLHEYIETPPTAVKRDSVLGLIVRETREGARSQDLQKYRKDAAILEQALRTETDKFLRSRYTFYLAQSYRDCGEREKALEAYLARADMGYWDQERFIALYQAANLKADLNYPVDDVIATYERATQTCPSRAEALHAVSRYCRSKTRNEEGFRYAERGLTIARPATGLFIESHVYDFGLLDELAVNGYWSSHFRASVDAAVQILASNVLPADQRPRVIANAQAALSKLPRDANLGSAAAPDLIAQHPLVPSRELQSRIDNPAPRVLVAILAKQKESFLPLYLDCIEALDYPKSSIVLYIRTNNNTDATETILRTWVARVEHQYAAVEFDSTDVDVKVEQFDVHEWNVSRFQVLGHIRNVSLKRTKAHECAFYFVADIDNFFCACTLRELVALDLPIVSPLLRSLAPGAFYSNFHAEVDANGYYRECDQYHWILNRWIRGAIEVPVIHCTYLIREDAIKSLDYTDNTNRHEYIVFSDGARRNNIPQYIDNRQIYGYITFGEGHDLHVRDGLEQVQKLLAKVRDKIPKFYKSKQKIQPHRSGSFRRKLIISPQAGFGNRLRTLCTGALLGLMSDREVFHYWRKDSALSHIEHVNDMKKIDPEAIFDLKIPRYDRPCVDVCFSEWMPGDFWFPQQSTAQSTLRCARVSKLPTIEEILSCKDDTVLIESSLELLIPTVAEARSELMHAIYQAYLPLNTYWQATYDAAPRYDVGISIRRGNFLHYNPGAALDIEKAAQMLKQWFGTKIVFSDDEAYAQELCGQLGISTGLNTFLNTQTGPNKYIAQFIILSKACKVLGTKGSSFPEQAAIYGGRPFIEL